MAHIQLKLDGLHNKDARNNWKVKTMAINTQNIAKKALEAEIFTAAIYDYLAAKYLNKAMSRAFAEVAEMEKGHIVFWSDFLRKRGADTTGVRSSSLRLTLYKLMLRIIGRRLTLRIIENGENQTIEMYSALQEDVMSKRDFLYLRQASWAAPISYRLLSHIYSVTKEQEPCQPKDT